MKSNSVSGKDWILKNYNEETVNFFKDNFNLSEIDLDTECSFSKCLLSHFDLSVSTKVCQIVELKGTIFDSSMRSKGDCDRRVGGLRPACWWEDSICRQMPVGS